MYIDQIIQHLNEHKYLYMIEHNKRKGWYLFDYAEMEQNNASAAVWYPNVISAAKFPTEEDVEEFASMYINPRPFNIVRMETKRFLTF